jgi:hypothetical protein
LLINDAYNPVAVATLPVMPFGVSGTTIETYAGRAWIGNGSKVQFSAPESPSDFSILDAAGAFQSTDTFLRVRWQQFKQTNGFLYLLADSSLNYISGVTVSGTPAVTIFSNQNVDPQIGVTWPYSVQLFSRNIVFANNLGVYVSYGGAVTKVSEPLDGIYESSSRLSGWHASSAVANIFNKQVYMILLPIVDLYTGNDVNKLCMWDGKRWWTSEQDQGPLTFINSQEINSQLTAYGTDGTHIWPLFQSPSTGFTKTVQSKLWSNPGYTFTKTSVRIAGIFQAYSDNA